MGASTMPAPRVTSAVARNRGVATAAESGRLLVAVVRHAVRPPFTWVPDALVEASTAVRRCLLPLFFSLIVYSVGYGVVLFGGILDAIGAAEREGGGYYIAQIRETAVWITTMIFAGVAGSAVASDLGARKVREELDALAVLGVDKVRSLATPRVLALTLICPVIGLLALLFTTATLYLIAPSALNFPPAVYVYSVEHSIITVDVAAFVLKLGCVGLLVGIVSCQKGLGCEGGSEGVGRAVNQTVVICFFGIWLLNSVFNLAFLTLFPETALLPG